MVPDDNSGKAHYFLSFDLILQIHSVILQRIEVAQYFIFIEFAAENFFGF
jgi:hypothetical protein